MGKTISELSDNMTMEELLLWQEYFLIQPSDIEKLRLQIAYHSVLYSSVNFQKKDKSEYTLQDIFLDFEQQPKKQNDIDEIEEFRENRKKTKKKLLEQIKSML